MLVLRVQTPSMVAAGCAGTNSESSTTVFFPLSVSSNALLPLGVPPRKTQFLKVMLAPVTFTYPWKSLPLMTAPLVANVWVPSTTVSAVPAGTPVLPGPGLPPRGPGAAAGGGDGARLGVGDVDGEADGLGEPESAGVADAGSVAAPACQDVPGRPCAQPATVATRIVPDRA